VAIRWRPFTRRVWPSEFRTSPLVAVLRWNFWVGVSCRVSRHSRINSAVLALWYRLNQAAELTGMGSTGWGDKKTRSADGRGGEGLIA